MHAEIERRKDEIIRICRRYGVARLDLFGSGARGYDFDPETSDADFVFVLTPPLLPGLAKRVVGFHADLAEAMGRKVDLLRSDTPDGSAEERLRMIRNPYRRAAIGRDLETVYAA